ncbi:hypothetical protein [Cupriavidus sp. YAF13]|uniref:hypothetical protein n=1 Tax=Cupriavidus sp. YAF13 TaxID=3233075 RepID=UPI003F90BF4C
MGHFSPSKYADHGKDFTPGLSCLSTAAIADMLDQRRITSGISEDDQRRLSAVVSSDTVAGWLGRGVCARNAGVLLTVHPRQAWREFRRRLALDGLEGTTLRAALLGGPPLNFTGTRAFKKVSFVALCETVLFYLRVQLPDANARLGRGR